MKKDHTKRNCDQKPNKEKKKFVPKLVGTEFVESDNLLF